MNKHGLKNAVLQLLFFNESALVLVQGLEHRLPIGSSFTFQAHVFKERMVVESAWGWKTEIWSTK